MAEAVAARRIPGTEGKNRVFVTVGKAVSAKAVERNKVKRRIRVIARSFFQKNPHLAVLVNARKGAAQMSFAELKNETIRALRKVV